MKRLFDIDDTGKVQLEDTTYMLVPELSDVYNRKKLGWKAITYIVCVCDYHSPYRQLLLADRIDAVCEDIYGTKNYPPLSLDIVEKAMEKYKKLQYDPIYEQYNIYTEKNTKGQRRRDRKKRKSGRISGENQLKGTKRGKR